MKAIASGLCVAGFGCVGGAGDRQPFFVFDGDRGLASKVA